MFQIPRRRAARGSAAGNIITLLLLLGVIGLGVYLWLGKKPATQPDAVRERRRR
jgi:NitT/TauT family transport system substrate-binding protein